MILKNIVDFLLKELESKLWQASGLGDAPCPPLIPAPDELGRQGRGPVGSQLGVFSVHHAALIRHPEVRKSNIQFNK